MHNVIVGPQVGPINMQNVAQFKQALTELKAQYTELAGSLLLLEESLAGVSETVDADTLGGEPGSFYQNASNLNSGSVPLAQIPTALTGKSADQLDGQEGNFYQDVGNATGILPLGCLPSVLTGKDADKLDGQEGSYYRNASNLNTGSVPLAVLSNLWRDNDRDDSAQPFVQAGTCLATGAIITFDVAYGYTPIVLVSQKSNSSNAFAWWWDVTTTGFVARGRTADGVNKNITISWIAIGRKA